MNTSATSHLTVLGQKGSPNEGRIETFPAPRGSIQATYTTDEMSALCPVTGQPDWYEVSIMVVGLEYPESKSLKLYLQSFRNQGEFCEALASRIAADICEATEASLVRVEIFQRPRGGISIEATSQMSYRDGGVVPLEEMVP